MSNTLNLGNGNWATKEGSVLGYNSENNNYKPLAFSFSRDSSATVVNKDGLIETVGTNEPRIDYKDDVKGAMLLEPSKTNIFDYSSDLSAWSKLNSTVTESSVLSLDGVNNSYVYERTSSSSSYIYRTVSLSNTTVYTLSFFVKSGTSTNVTTDIWDTTQSTQCQIQVDLATKTVSNFIGTSYKIEDYTNGWMRVSVTFTSESSFGTTFNRYFNADSVGTELYIWGAQLEQGSYATSYIPTQGSIGTRLAEECSQTVPDGVIGQTEGTMFFEIKPNTTLPSYTQRIVTLYENSSNLITFQLGGSNELTFVSAKSGESTVVITKSIPALNLGSFNKVAVSIQSNEFIFYINGVKVGQDVTSGKSMPIVSNIIFANYNASNPFLGNVNDFRIYNTALTDSELQQLTS